MATERNGLTFDTHAIRPSDYGSVACGEPDTWLSAERADKARAGVERNRAFRLCKADTAVDLDQRFLPKKSACADLGWHGAG